MFHGKNFISESDKRTLDRWIDQIESLTLRLLHGVPAWHVFSDVANEINIHNSIVDPMFLLPSFCQALKYHLEQESQGFMGDDSEMLCEALGNIGPRAMISLPILQQVVASKKHTAAKKAAETAISKIRE